MILPSKHLPLHRSLLGVGAELLSRMDSPATVSRLWNEIRCQRNEDSTHAPIDYRWYILALDMLFIIGAIDIQNGLIQLIKSSEDTR